MENIAQELTDEHIEALKATVRAAQEEYLTTDTSDRFSINVLVTEDLEIITDYYDTKSDNQICVHICSRGCDTTWEDFAEQADDLEGFLEDNNITFEMLFDEYDEDEYYNTRDYLQALEERFPELFSQYQAAILEWVAVEEWSIDELVYDAITRYEEMHGFNYSFAR